MTMEWEGEQEIAVEKVTLRCIARGLSASKVSAKIEKVYRSVLTHSPILCKWLLLVQQAKQDGEWDETSRDSLAVTLISCLRENSSAAPLSLQYISSGIATTQFEQLCSTTSIYKALLEDLHHLQLSNDILHALCSLLNTSPITSFEDFSSLFSTKRCTNGIHLMLLGCQYQEDSIMTLAGNLLGGFCLVLEEISMQERPDSKEEADCLEAIRNTIGVDLQRRERRVLDRLQAKLESRIAKREGLNLQSANKRDAQEADSHTLFLSLMETQQHSQSGWLQDHNSSALPKSVEPEIANLLQFLIDDYCSWQSKLDAVRALLNARLYHRPANVSDYEQVYLDLFYGTACGCATLAATPTSLGGDEEYTMVWRSALCGLLPSLIEALELERLQLNHMQVTPTREVMASVVHVLLLDAGHILTGCEVMLTSLEEKRKNKGAESGEDTEADMMLDVFIGSDDGPARHPVRAALLRSMEDKGLLRREDWKDVVGTDAVLADWQDLSPSFLGEVAGSSDFSSTSVTLSLANFFEQKLQGELQDESRFLTRMTEDHASQQAFSQALVKITCDCINSSEYDSLAKVYKLLMSDSTALDVVFLYICPTQLLQPIAGLLEDHELLQNEEEPAVIGTILLFAQYLVKKGLDANYTLDTLLPTEQAHFLASLTRSLPAVQVYSKLSTTEQSIVSNWITALFGSEGIPDELIKNSSPQLMLRMTPTLFSQSVTACYQGVIDMDTLRGGLTYFLQDLLSYTLPSAITWLLFDLSRCQYEEKKTDLQNTSGKAKWARQSLIRMEVLSMLILSETCPRIVQILVSKRVIEVLGQFAELNSEMSQVVAELTSQVELNKAAKTHLWIKIVLPAMPSCHVDSLLGLDASIGAIIRKRGVKAALQLILDNLLAHPKSEHLPRAIAMSLSLAHIEKKSRTKLADDVLVLFTSVAMIPRNRIKSVMLTLKLILEMLSTNSSSDKRCFDAIQAIIALRVKRMLNTAKNKEELNRFIQPYGLLFHHLDTCTVLYSSFSSAT